MRHFEQILHLRMQFIAKAPDVLPNRSGAFEIFYQFAIFSARQVFQLRQILFYLSSLRCEIA